MSIKKGYLCGIYIRTSGSYASPTFSEIDLVNDMGVDDPNEKLDADSRGAHGLREYEPGRMDLNIAGMIRKDPDDAVYILIAAAKAARTELDVMVLDGKQTTNGASGYRMDMKVFKFSEDQAAGKVLYKDFEFAPCPSDNAKQTVVVSGGVPVFTDITVS